MTTLLTRPSGRRTTAPRVGLCGLLGTGNLGNDGSLQAMIDLVRAEYPDAEFDCLCSGPDEIETRFGIPATRLNWYRHEYRTATGAALAVKVLGKIVDPVRVWAWVRRHDVVIVPGMGVLEGCFPQRSWGWLYSLLLVCAAGRCTRAKIALVNVGADELARALNRKMIVRAARLAHYRSFRDSLSRDAMRTMGLNAAAHDEVYPDLAFALPVPPEEPVRERSVGVGVMALPPGIRESPSGQAYVPRITEFVEWLLDNRYDVRLLTGDREDEAVAERIRSDLRTRRSDLVPDRLAVATSSSLRELMEQMRPLQVIVATRYHNIVCAVMLAKPTISIGYAAKNDVLMAEAGMPDACQRVESLDVPRLVEQFQDVAARRDVLGPLVAEHTRGRRRLLSRQAATLAAAVFPAPDARTAVVDDGVARHPTTLPSDEDGIGPPEPARGNHVYTDAVKRAIRGVQDRAYRVLTAAGIGRSERALAAEAHDYWSSPGSDRWESNSHWRDAPVFAGGDLWGLIGARHLDMVERAARAVGFTRPWGRVVEWGCGGGANAVHFAPRAGEFVGVDLTPDTLAECGRQVAAVCDTPWKPVQVDVTDPEAAVAQVEPCDLWLSYYVFELVPSREYGARLLQVAHRMLAPGGLACIQIKYSDGSLATRPRRWGYRSSVAGMTAYRIEEFWSLASECGFVPELVELRPHDELDVRYAYFTLRRP